MSLKTLALATMLGGAAIVSIASAQPAPCQTCQKPGCGYPGHPQGCCCCDNLAQQVPPNPLAPGRPTPPPCCADGFCYPNPATWGHYGTRWRRWPIEYAAPRRPGEAVPRPLGPDVPAYVPPPIEEEDRRAPPPSAPRAGEEGTTPRIPPQQEGVEEPPAEEPAAPTNGAAPAGTPATPPSVSEILGVPPVDTPPVDIPPDDPNLFRTPSDDAPIDESTPAAPFGEPMGDADLPPTPPFKTTTLQRRVSIPATTPPSAPPKPSVRTTPQDDPPPAMPALASLSHR